MTPFGWLAVGFVVVFVINIIPYFMPTAGRSLLALISSRWGRKLLSQSLAKGVSDHFDNLFIRA
jgi:hypothetical protein